MPQAGTSVRTTTCYMCACHCGICVHLREGADGPEVRYIEGNPEHPLNQGVICAKVSSGIMKQYLPARLTQPSMRKPGVGSAGWFALAFAVQNVGLLAERWHFFAQANHPQNLCYQVTS